jgi:hypothetical protein
MHTFGNYVGSSRMLARRYNSYNQPYQNYMYQGVNSPFSSSSVAHVAIDCDRKRIVSCSCTCPKQSRSWCSHIVAAALFRILEPNNVEFRAPVSESLLKLDQKQLQKFAQYLICELPRQVNNFLCIIKFTFSLI